MLEEYHKHLQETFTAIENLKNVDPEEIENTLKLFRKHPRVVFASMGKPAFAVNKIVYTARSFGLDFHNLDVTHCFHGDAGIVRRGDLLVFVSKSGETRETNEVAKYFEGWNTIAVTSYADSELAQICEHTLTIPMESEGSPWGYAPMISTTLYMIVLHAILCDTIKYSGCTLAEYARNHPGGDIGTELEKDGVKNVV